MRIQSPAIKITFEYDASVAKKISEKYKIIIDKIIRRDKFWTHRICFSDNISFLMDKWINIFSRWREYT